MDWIRDVRTALEADGIGWTMWDYRGGFGVVWKDDGQPAKVDQEVVEALGLKAKRGRSRLASSAPGVESRTSSKSRVWPSVELLHVSFSFGAESMFKVPFRWALLSDLPLFVRGNCPGHDIPDVR